MKSTEQNSAVISKKTTIARDKILKKILKGTYSIGQKIPTEPALVESLGFSRNTIREAVASLVHDGMLERRQGSGTFVVGAEPISGRAAFSSDTVRMGITHGPYDVLQHPSSFQLQLMKGISEPIPGYPKLDVRHLSVDPAYRNVGGVHYMDAVENGTIDVLVMAWFEWEDQQIEQIASSGFPVLIVGLESPWKQIPLVRWDLPAGVKKLVRFLCDSGKSEIGLLLDTVAGGTAVAFLSGAVAGLASRALPPDVSRTEYAQRDTAKIPGCVERLVKAGAKAIICYDDDIAVEAIRSLQNMGLRVPEDIVVTGANDTRSINDTDFPSLTTLCVPLVEIGRSVRDLAFEGARTGRIPAQTLLFEPELIVRHSAPARK